MIIRYDIVSDKTGRTAFSTALDAPSDGLTLKECRAAVSVLDKTRQQLEGIYGKGRIRVTYDGYANAVFWYLVLLRPIDFDERNPQYGGRQWTVYEMLQDPERAADLKQLDLGVVYDSERNRLYLPWPEAVNGILKDFEYCPSWKKILQKEEKRTKASVPKSWWKTVAGSHSYSIPTWLLSQDAVTSDKLWHRIGLEAQDVVAFDLNGIDFVLDGDKLEFPVAKRAHFTHFYTEDKREKNVLERHKDVLLARDGSRRPDWKLGRVRRERENTKRAHVRVVSKTWIEAGRVIQGLAKRLGSPIIGRYRTYLSVEDSIKLFERAVEAHRIGNLTCDVDWKKVCGYLDRLEPLLENEHVPDVFSQWLGWRNQGADVL